MKSFVAFALLAVSICAGSSSIIPNLADVAPNADQRFIVAGIVERQIEELIQQLQNSGLDPLNLESAGLDYAFPVSSLFSINAKAEDVEFSGISNIVINRINYGAFTSRLNFDLSLPEIALVISDAAVDIGILGGKISGDIRGRAAIVGVNISGNVRINIGIISGISIRSVDIDFSLGGIESDLEVSWLGKDRTDTVNSLLGTRIPNAIASYRADINEFLELIAWQVISSM